MVGLMKCEKINKTCKYNSKPLQKEVLFIIHRLFCWIFFYAL